MKKILAMISLALVIATLSGILCSCGGKKSLIGEWSDGAGIYSLTMRFDADGKGKVDGEEITYKVQGKKIKITNVSTKKTLTFKYSVKGDVLTLTGEGSEYVLYKVKTDKNSLIGTWDNEYNRITIKSGGKGEYMYHMYGNVVRDFTYKVNNNNIVFTFDTEDYASGEKYREFSFEVTNNTLTLTEDGYTQQYKKIK